jgi:hypothetical protein
MLLLALVAGCSVSANVIEGDLPPTPATASPAPPPRPAASCTTPSEPVCPATRPTEGTSCSSFGIATCEYGASVDPSCNDVVACATVSSGFSTWTTRTRGACAALACPATRDDVPAGEPCAVPDGGANDEILCPYLGAVCGCTTGPDGAHLHERRWVCVTLPTGCPAARPMRGQACSTSKATSCDYGSKELRGGVLMTCSKGVWLTGTPPCP